MFKHEFDDDVTNTSMIGRRWHSRTYWANSRHVTYSI